MSETKEDEIEFGIEEKEKTEDEILKEALNKKELSKEEIEQLFADH